MNIEIPYNFLILSAFTNILKYENRRVLKITNLEKFITEILKTIKVSYYLNKIINTSSDWHGEISFLEDAEYLNKFLEKYAKHFQKDNDALKLVSQIDYNDIWHLVEQEIKENQINNRFLEYLEDLDILKTLEITSIPHIVKKAIAMEKEIAKNYLGTREVKETMASYALKRILFLNNLKQCSEEVILCFLNVLVQMNDDDDMFFPMDYEKFKASAYYHGTNLEFMDKMCNYFNKAIFNGKNLAQEKLLMMIEDVMSYKWLQALEEEEEELDEEMEEVLEATALFEPDELKFCCAYLEKIEDFIEKYGENQNLTNTYNRLLYVLDDPTMELLDPEELEASKLDINETELIENEPLKDFASETYYFCEDIFGKEYDINTIKKILFISSYYDVTKDEKIIAILQKYNNHRYFTYYTELILGEDNDKILKRER